MTNNKTPSLKKKPPTSLLSEKSPKKKLVIAFVGIEGVGKTWNSNFFAKKYQTSLAQEYGQWYCQNVLKGYYQPEKKSFLTTKKDYYQIVQNQQKWWKNALDQAKKVCFFDTDLIYTKYFIDKQFYNWSWIDFFLPQQPIDLHIFLMTNQIKLKPFNIINQKNAWRENEKLLAYYRRWVTNKVVVIKEENYQLRQIKITRIINNFLFSHE